MFFQWLPYFNCRIIEEFRKKEFMSHITNVCIEDAFVDFVFGFDLWELSDMCIYIRDIFVGGVLRLKTCGMNWKW